MFEFHVTYDDGDDITTVWVTARSEDEAVSEVWSEYHDVVRIISVTKERKVEDE